MKQPTILALDTATEACSVALLYKGEKTGLFEVAERRHTKRILPMVEEILAASGISLRDLDALAFGRGPGSFTGVRVGAGVAQGLALGADLPVVAVSNLMAMAQAAFELKGAENVAAAIDARMNEVYFGQFVRNADSWEILVPEQVCAPEAAIAQLAPDAALVGTGWNAYAAFAQAKLQGSEIILPEAKFMLDLALESYLKGQYIDALAIEPVYLRNEVTWQKLPGRE